MEEDKKIEEQKDIVLEVQDIIVSQESIFIKKEK